MMISAGFHLLEFAVRFTAQALVMFLPDGFSKALVAHVEAGYSCQ